MPPGPRPVSVGEQIRRLLGPVLLHEVNDPRLRGLNISEVALSRDLRHARVYVLSAEPLGAARRAEARAGLASCAPFLRRVLARRGGLRYVPELRFDFDDSAETALRIERLLDGAAPPP